MVVIPQYEAREGLDTSPQTMPRIRIDTSAFEGLADLGRSISRVGEKMRSQQEKLQEFKAQQGWLKLNNELDGGFAEVVKDSQSDDGMDIMPTFRKDIFNPRVDEFIKTLPPDMAEEYKLRAKVLDSEFVKATVGHVLKKQEDMVNEGLADYRSRLIDDVYANPGNFEAARKASIDLINNSNKPASEKRRLKEQFYKDLIDAAATSMVEAGKFDEARNFIRGQAAVHEEKVQAKKPASMRGVLTPENWPLQMYKPEDLLGRRPGERFIQARLGYMADELARRFYNATGLRVGVNEPHKFDAGDVAGRRRGTTIRQGSPHVSRSQHHVGGAIDFQWQKLNESQRKLFLQMAMDIGFQGVGFYYGKSDHLHLDIGNRRTWGEEGAPQWARAIISGRRGNGSTFAAVDDAAANPVILKNYSYANKWVRKIDVLEKQAQSADSRAIKEAQNETYSTLVPRLFDEEKPLTDQELNALYEDDKLSPGQYRSLMRAVTTETAKDTEDGVFKQFVEKAEIVKSRDDYNDLEAELIDAYADRQITRTHMSLVLRRARTVSGLDANDRKNPLITSGRKRLSTLTFPKERQDKKGLIRRLDALEKYDDIIAGIPADQLTREKIHRVVDDLAKQFSEEDDLDRRKNMKLSAYFTKGKYKITISDVEEAALKLQADRDANKISPEDLQKEVLILKSWMDMLRAEEEKK